MGIKIFDNIDNFKEFLEGRYADFFKSVKDNKIEFYKVKEDVYHFVINEDLTLRGHLCMDGIDFTNRIYKGVKHNFKINKEDRPFFNFKDTIIFLLSLRDVCEVLKD